MKTTVSTQDLIDSFSDEELLLLQEHIEIYSKLDAGIVSPITEYQKHFTRVCLGSAEPSNEHERLYIKYKYVISVATPQKSFARESIESAHNFFANSTILTNKTCSAIFQRTSTFISRNCSSIVSFVSRKNDTVFTITQFSVSTLSNWTSLIFLDAHFLNQIEKWLGHTFNSVSNVYTQAMDVKFLAGMSGQSEWISPKVHRIVDGNHTLTGAWDAVRDALPDDTFAEEVGNYFIALGTDLCSKSGLPLFTISKGSLNNITGSLQEYLLIPKSWTIDILTVNVTELFGSSLFTIALLLNWNDRDKEEFISITTNSAISAIYCANPILGTLTLTMLAFSFQKAHKAGETKNTLEGIIKGICCSSSFLLTSSLIAGPAWIGIVAGICIGGFLSSNLKKISVIDVAKHYTSTAIECIAVKRFYATPSPGTAS